MSQAQIEHYIQWLESIESDPIYEQEDDEYEIMPYDDSDFIDYTSMIED